MSWQRRWSAPRPMTTPMSAERFTDRFRYFKGQTQQQRGVQQLYAAISSSNQGTAILDEQAHWALTYSEEAPAQRAVDYVAGATEALKGHCERIADSTFVFTPSGTPIEIGGTYPSSDADNIDVREPTPPLLTGLVE